MALGLAYETNAPRPNPGGVQSAPFQFNCTSLLLIPDPGAQALVTFGANPTPVVDGIVIPGTTTLQPQGARLAVL